MRSTSIPSLLPALLFGGGGNRDENPWSLSRSSPRFFIDPIAGDRACGDLVGRAEPPPTSLLSQMALLQGQRGPLYRLRRPSDPRWQALSVALHHRCDRGWCWVLRGDEQLTARRPEHRPTLWLGHDQAKVLGQQYKPSLVDEEAPPHQKVPAGLIIRSTHLRRGAAPALRQHGLRLPPLLRLLPRLLWYHARGGGDGWQGADCQGP